MDMPAATRDCAAVSELLGLVGDKWTVRVIVALRDRPRRFNDIRRQVDGISQQMLTRTLKALERDGLIDRTVRASTPPQVDYALTDLGRSLSDAVRHLAEWVSEHRATIHEQRRRYDLGSARPARQRPD